MWPARSRGTVYFGAGANGEVNGTNNSNGAGDLFVAKYDAQNNLLWVTPFAADMHITTTAPKVSLALDLAGNAYVAGFFDGVNVTFDQPAGSPTLSTTNGSNDAFVVKVNSDGTVGANMARSFGNFESDEALAITVAPTQDAIYLGGYFQDTVDFNPGGTGGTLTAPGGTSADRTSPFLLKLATTDLGFDWVRGGTTVATGQINSVATDSVGNVYAAGMNTNGTELLMKYSPTGDPLASITYAVGGYPDVNNSVVATDATGNVYVAGLFRGTDVNFNPAAGASTTLTSASNQPDAFLARFDPRPRPDLGAAVRLGRDRPGDGAGGQHPRQRRLPGGQLRRLRHRLRQLRYRRHVGPPRPAARRRDGERSGQRFYHQCHLGRRLHRGQGDRRGVQQLRRSRPPRRRPRARPQRQPRRRGRLQHPLPPGRLRPLRPHCPELLRRPVGDQLHHRPRLDAHPGSAGPADANDANDANDPDHAHDPNQPNTDHTDDTNDTRRDSDSHTDHSHNANHTNDAGSNANPNYSHNAHNAGGNADANPNHSHNADHAGGNADANHTNDADHADDSPNHHHSDRG